MTNENHAIYDLSDVYAAEIAPLVAQPLAVADEHEFPIIVSGIYRQDEAGSHGFAGTGYSPDRVYWAAQECMAD